MKKRLGLLVLLLAFLLVWTGGIAEAKTLVIGTWQEAMGLDGRVEPGVAEAERSNTIMEALLCFNHDMELTPRLATDWEHSDDGLEITFYLREGVYFHHGREFVADDVKYTYEWLLDPDNEAPNRSLYIDIVEIEIVNDHEIIFHLREPNGFLINNIARMNIVPRDKAEELGDEFGSRPVGTGPFIFDTWRRDDRMVLKANPDYWGGAPKVDELQFRVIPSDSARLMAFEAGEIHMFQGGVDALEIERLEEDPNIVVGRAPGPGYEYVGFNQKSPLMNDYRIRQAVSHLINREGIVDHVLGGIGSPAYSPIPPMLPWHHDGLEPHAYDPEKARQLLAEAGYPDGGFSLSLHTSDVDHRMEIAEILAYELGELGVDVEIRIEEWGAFWDRIMHTTDYDMYILSWHGQLDPDRATYRQFHSEGGRYDYIYYDNARVNMLLDEGRIVPADSDRSLEIYREVQEIIYRDVPYAFIFYIEEIALSQPYITGFEVHPYHPASWENAHLFDIED